MSYLKKIVYLSRYIFQGVIPKKIVYLTRYIFQGVIPKKNSISFKESKRNFSKIQDSFDSFQALLKCISLVVISRVILLNLYRPDAGSAVEKLS